MGSKIVILILVRIASNPFAASARVLAMVQQGELDGVVRVNGDSWGALPSGDASPDECNGGAEGHAGHKRQEG